VRPAAGRTSVGAATPSSLTFSRKREKAITGAIGVVPAGAPALSPCHVIQRGNLRGFVPIATGILLSQLATPAAERVPVRGFVVAFDAAWSRPGA
jgi:hypothetical protein